MASKNQHILYSNVWSDFQYGKYILTPDQTLDLGKIYQTYIKIQSIYLTPLTILTWNR